MRNLRNLSDTRKFGDIFTADHTSYYGGVGQYGLHSQALLFIIKDMYSGYVASCPVASKCTPEVHDALQHFLGTVRSKNIYSDNADDIIRAMKDLGFGGRH